MGIGYSDIGKDIKDRMVRHGLNSSFVASKFSAITGLRISTTHQHISYYRGGFFYGTASRIGIQRNGGEYLQRFATFLHILGYSNRHELVRRIRKIDSRFIYPQENSARLEVRL